MITFFKNFDYDYKASKKLNTIMIMITLADYNYDYNSGKKLITFHDYDYDYNCSVTMVYQSDRK